MTADTSTRFLRFDVSKVRFMSVVAIPLAPQRARVGVDVRVVGNDAGEKVRTQALSRHPPRTHAE
jgi:hypothetical protein